MAFRHALFAFLPLPRIYRRRVWHPAIPTPPSEVLPQISQKFTDFSQGVQQSLLHQPSTRAPTLQSSHGIHRIHRSFWQRKPPTDRHRCAQIRRVWHPAIPTPPSDNPPTEFTEFIEASGREEPPTDFTDIHRYLGCVGFSHRIHRSFWWRRASYGFHRCAQMVWLRCSLSVGSVGR